MTVDARRLRLNFDSSQAVLVWALHMQRLGFAVLPIYGVDGDQCDCGNASCSSPGKHPIGSLVPNGVKDATTDPDVLRAWHRRRPRMNYAVRLTGFVVVDADSLEAYRQFLARCSSPPTLGVKTARGYHRYYRGEVPPRIGVWPKLDVKSGADSYVLGPGSLHATGVRYAPWEDEPIADLPDSVRGFISRERGADVKADGRGKVAEGGRNRLITSIAGFLHSRGVPLIPVLYRVSESICEQPLSEAEVRAIARSVSKYESRPQPTIRSFAEIEDEQLEWLWYPYICLGTLGLLDGNPGDGKSQFTIWLAALITRGLALPGGSTIKPANVFLLNLEDLQGAVIKKRLEANGADLERVMIQSKRFQLTPELVDWLEGEIARHKARLVILDPIQGFITSDVDTNSHVDVRQFMTRLAEVAERQGCAIICVRHFGKASHDKAMKNGLGSTDFIGIARNQFGLARRRDGPRGFVVFHLKTNFEHGDAMLFTMSEADGRTGEQPRITFDQFTKVDADDFFSSGPAKRGPDQDEREVAKAMLNEMLADGPQPAKTLKDAAKARDISASTLERARQDLYIKTRKKGTGWEWILPDPGDD